MDNIILKNSKKYIASDILKPDTAYNHNDIEQRKIYYISDIHLLHHVTMCNWKKEVAHIVKQLFTKEIIDDILNYERLYFIFCGDICSSSEIAKYFFHLFKIRYLFYLSKAWNKDNEKVLPISKELALNLYRNKIYTLENKLKKISYQLQKLGYDLRKQKSNIKLINKNNCSEYIHYKISEFEDLKDELNNLKDEKSEYIKTLVEGQNFDYKKYGIPIFVVLGNHELNDFNSIEEAVNCYSNFFKEEGIFFLHNNMLTSKYINIFGGIGFAKFNHEYNANTLCSTNPPITREEEIKESEKFLEKYNRALKESIEDNKLLIIITHYPVKDWLGNENFHSICVYFNGHSHHNFSINTSAIQVYADNQIGYKNNNIQFKSTNLGVHYNPFIDYKDGYYEINTIQYNQFLLHKGEYIQGTKLIDLQLESGNAKFYMVKQNDFYSFFVVNQKTGTKICVGGRLKTISKIKDIEYFNSCFYAMLNKYLSITMPYRKVQEQISNELKQLGFEGKIHGCIIDIDYFHHVLLDPTNGKLTFYYSPIFGVVKTFNSFKSLISTLYHDDELKFNTKSLSKYNDYLILQTSKKREKNIENILFVDRKNSIYSLSSRINQLQRLFNSNILREWRDDWAQETLSSNSKYLSQSYIVPVKSDEECDKIIKDRFSEFIVIEKEEKGLVLWTAKKILKQEIMYSICRKFISTYASILEQYEKINFSYGVFDKEGWNFNNINVTCLLTDIFTIHKKLLSIKFGHNGVSFRLEYDKNLAEISISLKGKKDILNYVGNYEYINGELIKCPD